MHFPSELKMSKCPVDINFIEATINQVISFRFIGSSSFRFVIFMLTQCCLLNLETGKISFTVSFSIVLSYCTSYYLLFLLTFLIEGNFFDDVQFYIETSVLKRRLLPYLIITRSWNRYFELIPVCLYETMYGTSKIVYIINSNYEMAQEN